MFIVLVCSSVKNRSERRGRREEGEERGGRSKCNHPHLLLKQIYCVIASQYGGLGSELRGREELGSVLVVAGGWG